MVHLVVHALAGGVLSVYCVHNVRETKGIETEADGEKRGDIKMAVSSDGSVHTHTHTHTFGGTGKSSVLKISDGSQMTSCADDIAAESEQFTHALVPIQGQIDAARQQLTRLETAHSQEQTDVVASQIGAAREQLTQLEANRDSLQSQQDVLLARLPHCEGIDTIFNAAAAMIADEGDATKREAFVETANGVTPAVRREYELAHPEQFGILSNLRGHADVEALMWNW